MNRSSLAIFGREGEFSLEISPPSIGLFKCRVVYDMEVREIEFLPYVANRIETLKVVYDDTLEYEFKFTNRAKLDLLYQSKGSADDILIVKDGRVTDTSYGNIVFFDGEAWITPNKPLLKGVYREKLLEEGLVYEQDVKVSDLGNYQKFSVINSMRRFDYQSGVKLV